MPVASCGGVLARYGPLLGSIALGLAGAVVGDAGAVGVPAWGRLVSGEGDGDADVGGAADGVLVVGGCDRGGAAWVAGPRAGGAGAVAALPAEGAGRTNA